MIVETPGVAVQDCTLSAGVSAIMSSVNRCPSRSPAAAPKPESEEAAAWIKTAKTPAM
jgi:hypothetical protein